MEQIKMCPYCGSGDGKIISYTCFNVYMYVLCPCGARGPESDNEEDAVLLWNAAANQIEALRADLAEAQEQLRLTISREVATHAKLQSELQRVEAGDKRQDALEAEIERLRNDLRLRGDERTAISIGYIEATEECDKLREERDDAIAKYTEDHRLYLQASDKWREDYWKVKDELSKTKILLDEARAWARRLYHFEPKWRRAIVSTKHDEVDTWHTGDMPQLINWLKKAQP